MKTLLVAEGHCDLHREISPQETFVGSRVSVLTWEDTLVEEGPQIERGTVFHRDTCHREISTQETVVTSGSRVKRVLTWAMSKWRKTL